MKDKIILEDYDRSERVRLNRKAIKYVIIGEVFYKNSFDGSLLRCLIQYNIIIALEQVHDGLCGVNFFTKVLYTKLSWIGYYWPTMKEDWKNHIKTCLQFQKHANLEK